VDYCKQHARDGVIGTEVGGLKQSGV